MPWLRASLSGLWPRLLGAEALLLVATAASLAASWRMGLAIDATTAGRADLLPAAVGYLALVLVGAAATWSARVLLERIAQDAMLRLKGRLFAHVLTHDVALHDALGAGRLVSRVIGDVDALRTALSEAVLQAPADLALFAGLLVVLASSAPSLALVAAASVPFYAVALVWYRGAAPPRMLASRAASARITGFYAEHLRALPVLRAYDRLDWVRARGAALATEKMLADNDAGLAGVRFFNGLFAIRAMTLASMVWVGAVQVQSGALSVGVLLVALDYARKMTEPFLRLQFQLTNLERARAGAARVTELLARAPTIRRPDAPVPWPGLRDAARLVDVEFAYPPDDALAERGTGGASAPPRGGDAPHAPSKILSGVSLTIPAGARVALVGPTGGGKSTIVQLLLRFRDVDHGAVTVDGVDVRALDPDDLRRRIGLVAQGVQVLPGTAAENLGVPEAEAAALLAEVGLGGRLSPDTRLGPGGATLSRGEAQLLCVARALAGDPALLVLDEATSAMDPATEAVVQAVIARRQLTVLCVAHRLRTITAYDRVYVIVGGRVAEEGTHPSLVAAGGVYAGLWAAWCAAEGEGA